MIAIAFSQKIYMTFSSVHYPQKETYSPFWEDVMQKKTTEM